MAVPETTMLSTTVPATPGRLQSFAVILHITVNINRTEAAFGSRRTFEEYTSHITAETWKKGYVQSSVNAYTFITSILSLLAEWEMYETPL